MLHSKISVNMISLLNGSSYHGESIHPSIHSSTIHRIHYSYGIDKNLIKVMHSDHL